VDDRARHTKSAAVALSNRYARVIQIVTNRLLGDKLLSLQAVLGSITVSVSTVIFLWATLLGIGPEFYKVPGFLIAICALVSLLVPMRYPHKIIRFLCSLPALLFLSVWMMSILNSEHGLPHDYLIKYRIQGSIELAAALFFSISTDFFALVLIRVLLAWIAKSISAVKIAFSVVTLHSNAGIA
jgi:hypothetical protein